MHPKNDLLLGENNIQIASGVRQPRRGGLELKLCHNELQTFIQLEYYHKTLAPAGLALYLFSL